MEFGRNPQMKVSYRWFSEHSYICKEQSPSIVVTENLTSALSGSCSVPYASRLRMKFVFWCWVIVTVGCNAERISRHIEHQPPRTEDWLYFLFIYEFPYFSIKCQHSGQ